jgi:hypothetical protein
MKRLVLACALLLALPGSAVATTVKVDKVVATTNGETASLGNTQIERAWRAGSAGVVTTSLRSGRKGTEWSNGNSPDFTLDLAGVSASSISGWSLRSVTARREPADPARPSRRLGAQLVFSYGLDPVGLVTLERTYTLRPGSAVFGVTTVLHNGSPAPLRVNSFSLDELTSGQKVSANVLTYHGGSDWRDDYRVASHEPGDFDDEGEVARFDNGSGAGWFFVSERRSGSASRAGRSGARTWIGADYARDAFDAGPLLSDPPNYNRVDNPAYPAPVRARIVPPLGSLRLGRSYTGVYNDGEQGAGAAFVREFAANEMPNFPRTVGLNTFHPWGHGDGMSDANLRKQVDLAASLGLESFMLDDQWQGGTGGESGDWQFDPARFPDAKGFVDYVHSKGLKLGLWMSPLEFNMASQTYAAHPDWACAPVGDVTAQAPDDAGLGVWDATNPAFQDYLAGVVDRLIQDYGVAEFKFDFMAWLDCPPHDYLDYEDAFVSLVRRMEAAHPGVTFELDETNDQRAWPFESQALGPAWFDNGHVHAGTAQSKVLHDIWSAAPWLPPSAIGMGALDGTVGGAYSVDYLMPMALLSHITFWTDLSKLSSPDQAETAWWIAWYKAHRSALGGLVYEDTSTDPLDAKAWAVFQPWTGRRGYVFAFRQADGTASQAVVLHGVRAGATYSVTDIRSGQSLGEFSGADLATKGLDVTLASPYSAAVLAVAPV